MLCCEGIREIGVWKTEHGVSLLRKGICGLGKNSDQQVLKCICLQVLLMFYDHSNNLDGSLQFSQMALNLCKEIGVPRLFLFGVYETTTEKVEERRSGTALQNIPLILEIVYFLSLWLTNNPCCLFHKIKHKLSNIVCEMQREVQLQNANELYDLLEIGDAALFFLCRIGQETGLNETIQSLKREIEKEGKNDKHESRNKSTSKTTVRQNLLKERLAQCYIFISLYHSKKKWGDIIFKSLQHSLDVMIMGLPGENRDATACYSEIGTEQYKIALEFLQRALDIRLKLYGKQHTGPVEVYGKMGEIHFLMENYTLALEVQQLLLDIKSKLFDGATSAWSYYSIGLIQLSMGDYTSALKFSLHALDIRLKEHEQDGKQHFPTAYSYLAVGMTKMLMKNYKETLDSYYCALKIFLNLNGELSNETGHCYRAIGMVWRTLGNKKLALNNCQRALDIRLKIYGEYHPLMIQSDYDIFVIEQMD